MEPDPLTRIIRLWLSDVRWFSRLVAGRPLRKYQLEAAQAILKSALFRQGLEFGVLYPRQSGKNELQAQMILYLLNLFQATAGAELIHASPTFQPQARNAMRRVLGLIDNEWNRGRWRSAGANRIELGQAAATFLSASPGANVVGATANVLLLVDEAQHVAEHIFNERFAPMAASSNATIAYFGTAWTSRTLLANTIRSLREQERTDGVQRVFIVTPEQVAAENPPYGAFVARQVAKLGRTHPLVKTQYFNETIDAEGGMFPLARRALMQGDHPRRRNPEPGKLYALLLDVAGEDEGAPREGYEAETFLANPRRDSTALTVVEVIPPGLQAIENPKSKIQNPTAPAYLVADRHEWIGVKHTALYAQIRALFAHWRARYLVADATGVGAGLVAFLSAALGDDRVIPYEFSSKTKSDLGYAFLAVIDTGRFKDWKSEPGNQEPDGSIVSAAPGGTIRLLTSDIQRRFFEQLEYCQYEVLPGPGHLMRWHVPDGTRAAAGGELIHDDLILSAALCAALDDQDWSTAAPALVVPAPDPLAGKERDY